MDLITQFKTMAQYNTWMNRSIYGTCAALSDEERKRDLHAFFGSIHRTLNHLLLTDRVQMGRFVGADRTRSFDANGNPIEILARSGTVRGLHNAPPRARADRRHDRGVDRG